MLSIFPNINTRGLGLRGPQASTASSFDRLSQEVDRLFEHATATLADPRRLLAAPTGTSTRRDALSTTWPGLNVWRDRENNIVAEAEIPGFSMNDIDVLITGDTLTIRGQRTNEVPEGATPLRVERSVRRFERSLRLPMEVDADTVEAVLNNGVLRIVMPIAEAARPRRVQVQTITSDAGTATRHSLTADADTDRDSDRNTTKHEVVAESESRRKREDSARS